MRAVAFLSVCPAVSGADASPGNLSLSISPAWEEAPVAGHPSPFSLSPWGPWLLVHWEAWHLYFLRLSFMVAQHQFVLPYHAVSLLHGRLPLGLFAHARGVGLAHLLLQGWALF